ATSEPTPDLKLEQPFSLKAALKFGVIFLVLSVAGVLAQRSLGVFGTPGRVQSLNPRAWRTNSTFCSASSIQAMTDTSLVGRVLAIFGRGLGIRLYSTWNSWLDHAKATRLPNVRIVRFRAFSMVIKANTNRIRHYPI